jgi:hypothetical protein
VESFSQSTQRTQSGDFICFYIRNFPEIRNNFNKNIKKLRELHELCKKQKIYTQSGQTQRLMLIKIFHAKLGLYLKRLIYGKNKLQQTYH